MQIKGDNRPHIRVTLGDLEFTALIDSGANRSVINMKTWSLLKSNFNKYFKTKNINVISADGSDLDLLGSVTLPVVYGKRKINFEFLILPKMNQDVVLGADICNFLKIRLSFSPNNVRINTIVGMELSLGITSEQKDRLIPVIAKFSELAKNKLSLTNMTTFNIDTGDAKPFRLRQYPLSPALMRQLNSELDIMLEQGIVEPSKSPWCSPVLMVKKKSGEYRFCFDGRRLNAVTVQDSYPLPRIDTILSGLGNAKFFSTIDLKSAFFQVPLDEDSRQKTAFAVPGRGLFSFCVMPFGLSNSPRQLQRLMDNLFGPEFAPNIFCYLDDLLILSPTFEHHLELLKKVFDKLKEANLSVNLEKCKFCRSSIPFLGFVVDSKGIHSDPEKVRAVELFPRPSTVTQIKRFIGLIGWYRRFIPDFSTLSSSITALISGKKKSNPIVWTEAAENAFVELKSRLSSAPVLVSPDFSKPFIIQTDASATALAAVLYQEIEGHEHPIAFASKTMTSAQRNYSVTEQEALAVLFGIEKFRQYVEGSKFKVVTDHHSLLWLKSLKNPSGRLCRWAITLSQFDFDVEHRKGALNVVADALSRINLTILEIKEPIQDEWYLALKAKILAFPDKYPLFRVDNGKIFKLFRTAEFSGTNNNDWKLVVPQELRLGALKECHDEPTSAHLGILKTLGRLKELYYWPSMRNDVVKYINACKICAQVKHSSQPKSGFMGQAKSVAHPFQMLSIDFLGPLPRSKAGNQFILVITDCFTKFVFLKAMSKATSRAVCRYLEEEVFLMFGVPQSIVCDNGSQFISKEFVKFLDSYKVQKIFYNARYHPQHNPAERVNRTIISSISAYLHENHRLWDVNLPKIAQAIRLATHEATGKSPAFLTFGRLVPTAGNFYGPINKNTDNIPPILDSAEHGKAIEQLTSYYPKIRENLKLAHQRAAQRYNLRRREVVYKPGDRVWKKNFVQSNAAEYFSSKLAPKYIPCVITRRVGGLVYELEDVEGNKLGRWHVQDFKPDLA